MNIQEQLCQAFCDTLKVTRVPAGLAIGTDYAGLGGDHIGLYVIGPDALGNYVVQDDGITIPTLEGLGADLDNKVRREAFAELQRAYGVEFDEETGELTAKSHGDAEVAPTVLRFIAFMLRIQDLAFMAIERAASTFKVDALKELRAVVGSRAVIHENYVIADSLSEFPADVGILAEDKPPLALFWGTTESKVLEALLLQSYATNNGVECSVGTMLEHKKSVAEKWQQRASNHLDFVTYFNGTQREACARVAREVLGYDPTASRTLQ
jgi:hypothetical protein